MRFQTKHSSLVFWLCLLLLLLDRALTFFCFGISYTDIDQMILWNGALDYSKGVFMEPFFYGQAYNYMVEALLAVPLIWVGMPVYFALPLVSGVLSVFPFVVPAFLFRKKGQFFWACTLLVLPVLLPLEYNLLTSVSRGFLQAHLFVPLLFYPMLYPMKKGSMAMLYVGSALCFFANQSSILLVLPVFTYVS